MQVYTTGQGERTRS